MSGKGTGRALVSHSSAPFLPPEWRSVDEGQPHVGFLPLRLNSFERRSFPLPAWREKTSLAWMQNAGVASIGRLWRNYGGPRQLNWSGY